MKRFYLIALAVFTLAACSKEDFTPSSHNTMTESSDIIAMPATCGSTVIYDLTFGQTNVYGTITIGNDGDYIYVDIDGDAGLELDDVHIFVGECGTWPSSGGTNGCTPIPGQFDYNVSGDCLEDHEAAIPMEAGWQALSDAGNLCVLVHVAVCGDPDNGDTNPQAGETGWGGPDRGDGSGNDYDDCTNRWFYYSVYAIQDCGNNSSSSGCDTGDFRTQTMGGWGTICHGDNPGCYRDSMFAISFPGGLTVGCTETITLTSTGAVEEFLPCGGTPAALTASYTDPSFGTVRNTLAGQLVALTLSVQFDYDDADFGASSNNLGDLVVAAGTFAGMTVNDLLVEGNLILGGCVSNYSATEINEALSAVNESFVDGTTVSSYLLCP